ncbi:MAG: hypothetical protein ACKO5K_03265 [Armatimonadota bacterium]
MPEPLDPALHRRYAATFFNATWDYLDKTDRTTDEDDAMLLHAYASLLHWMKAPEGTALNRSVGWWQVSRVLAVLGRGEEALAAAGRGLWAAQGESPFYVAYGHEARARALAVSGESHAASAEANTARAMLPAIEDEAERGLLQADLAQLP